MPIPRANLLIDGIGFIILFVGFNKWMLFNFLGFIGVDQLVSLGEYI